MTRVTINDWEGGIAEDVRELRTDTFAVAKNFDIKSYPNRLVPHLGTINQPLAGTKTYGSGAVLYSGSNGVRKISFLARQNGTDLTGAFIGQTTDTIGDAVSEYTNANIPVHSIGYGTLTVYKNKLFSLMYNTSTGYAYLLSYDHVASSLIQIGSFTFNPVNLGRVFIPKPFRHSADDILYVAAGNVVARNNNGSWTGNALTLPSDCWITSLTEYGNYLAIATAPRDAGGRSRVFLWNRDISLTTVTDIIDFGEGELRVLENIDGYLVGISISNSTFAIQPQLKMYAYAGGTAQLVRSITAPTGSQTQLEIFKSKRKNELYFTAKFPIQGNILNRLWVAGRNRKGQWYMSPDRSLNGPTEPTTVNGFDFVGDYMYVGFDSGQFSRTHSSTGAVYGVSSLDTLINPKMILEDRIKRKTLISMTITTSKGSGTGQHTIAYSVDGSDFTTIYTGQLSPNQTIEIITESDGRPLKSGREFQFRIGTTESSIASNQPDITEFTYEYETTASYANPNKR